MLPRASLRSKTNFKTQKSHFFLQRELFSECSSFMVLAPIPNSPSNLVPPRNCSTRTNLLSAILSTTEYKLRDSTVADIEWSLLSVRLRVILESLQINFPFPIMQISPVAGKTRIRRAVAWPTGSYQSAHVITVAASFFPFAPNW